MKNLFTKEQESEILSISYKFTAKELATMYGCSKSLILKIWSKNNFHKKNKRSYYVNDYYFSNINTKNKSYILGLLASDGTIYKRNNNCQGLIQLKLKEEDEYILKDILQDMDSTYPVNKINNNGFYQSLFSISSEQMYKDLINIGIKEKKTWNMNLFDILDNITKEFKFDFIRGYFDGDGCITELKNNQISKVHISFSCPFNFAKQLKEELKKYEIDSKIFIDNHKNYSNLFCNLEILGTLNKYCFLKFIYSNLSSNKDLFLKRKYQKAIKFIKAVENNITNRFENIKAIEKYNKIKNVKK